MVLGRLLTWLLGALGRLLKLEELRGEELMLGELLRGEELMLGELLRGEELRGEELMLDELLRGEELMLDELLGRPPPKPPPPGRRPCALLGTASAIAAAVTAITANECKFFLSIMCSICCFVNNLLCVRKSFR